MIRLQRLPLSDELCVRVRCSDFTSQRRSVLGDLREAGRGGAERGAVVLTPALSAPLNLGGRATNSLRTLVFGWAGRGGAGRRAARESCARVV